MMLDKAPPVATGGGGRHGAKDIGTEAMAMRDV
jgi:hypothetical protein